MPVNVHIDETTSDDGSTAQKLVVEFTNGSLAQLRDLGQFLKIEGSEKDPYKVIEFAIGVLETVKSKTPSKEKTSNQE